MAQAVPVPDRRSLSELLASIQVEGRTWCYTDLAGPSGFSLPPSDALMVHCVLHGSVRIACTAGERADLVAGDVAFVPSGEAHALRTVPEAATTPHPVLRGSNPVDVPPGETLGQGSGIGARVLTGRLSAEWPGGVKGAALPSLLHLAAGADPLAGLLGAEAIARAGIGAGSAALLTRIAAMLLVAALRGDPRARGIFAPPEADPVRMALDLIEANPSAPWSVEKLARSVGMGRSNFAAQFTAGAGRAPMEVVAEKRMEHAASLLRQSRLKVAEISELAGYGSEAAFSRRFTRHFGVSPGQLREAARAEAAEPADGIGFASFLSGPMPETAPAIGRSAPEAGAPASDAGDKVLGLRGILLRGSRRGG